jgi:hypothetical protein
LIFYFNIGSISIILVSDHEKIGVFSGCPSVHTRTIYLVLFSRHPDNFTPQNTFQ